MTRVQETIDSARTPHLVARNYPDRLSSTARAAPMIGITPTGREKQRCATSPEYEPRARHITHGIAEPSGLCKPVTLGLVDQARPTRLDHPGLTGVYHVRTEQRYVSDDPYAVTIVFFTAQGPGFTWTFARDLLAPASTAGQATGRAGGSLCQPPRPCIALLRPHTQGRHRLLREFRQATYELVGRRGDSVPGHRRSAGELVHERRSVTCLRPTSGSPRCERNARSAWKVRERTVLGRTSSVAAASSTVLPRSRPRSAPRNTRATIWPAHSGWRPARQREPRDRLPWTDKRSCQPVSPATRRSCVLGRS